MRGTRSYKFIVISGDNFINKREPKERPHPSPCLAELGGGRRCSCTCPGFERRQHFQGMWF